MSNQELVNNLVRLIHELAHLGEEKAVHAGLCLAVGLMDEEPIPPEMLETVALHMLTAALPHLALPGVTTATFARPVTFKAVAEFIERRTADKVH